MARILIGNFIEDVNSPHYYKLMWRIPFKEFKELGWICVPQGDVLRKSNPAVYLEKTYGKVDYVFGWNCSYFLLRHYKKFAKRNIKILFYMDDLHHDGTSIRNRQSTLIKESHLVISTYKYTFNKYFPDVSLDKVYWFPHSYPTNFKIEFNEDPITKILITGNCNWRVYPYRRKMIMYRKRGYPDAIDTLQHPGYAEKREGALVGYDYYKYMSKYIASFSCCSNEKTPYVVAKTFEIPATGALLLMYDDLVKEPMKELGFIDKHNYLSVNDDNMEDVIKFIIDPSNKDKITEMRRNGYEHVWKNHLHMNRCKDLDTYLGK